MRRSSRLVAGTFAFAFALTVSGCEHSASPVSENAHVIAGDLATKLVKTFPIPGIAIVVVHNGVVDWQTAGDARVNPRTAFTDSTLFFTGSLSEPVVATAVLRMAMSGMIDLNDRVVKHLPYFRMGSDNYHRVTIRHLLTHTSGVPRHDVVWDLPDNSPDALENTTRSIALEPPKNRPGAQVARSAYNYDILADLIAKVSQMPFEDFVEKEVFRPLHMSRSTFRNVVPQRDAARPHHVQDWLRYSFSEHDLYPYNREHAGSNGFHTCAADAGKWMKAMIDQPENFLRTGLWNELLKAQYQTSPASAVGLGWDIALADGALYLTKSHQLGGFAANITLAPDRRSGILVATNVAGFHASAVSRQLLNSLATGTAPDFKIPGHVALGKKLAATGNLDSVLRLYDDLKRARSHAYDLSMEAVSELGVTLLYRVKDIEKATRFLSFCLEEFKDSEYARLNLAEAYLLGNRATSADSLIRTLSPRIRNDPAIVPRLKYLEEALIIKDQTPTKP